jgi:hypothetical protein
MGLACFACVAWAGCGITVPGGGLEIGIDPSMIGAAGRGAFPGTAGAAPPVAGVAGVDGGVAGRRPVIVGGAPGSGGFGEAGSAGVTPPWVGTAGRWGGVAGTGAIPTQPWIDVDGDGWDSRSDCNDFDWTIHPGLMDACCDGVDSDCDGRDSPVGARCKCASVEPNFEPDRDRDGWTVSNGDCDDNNAWTNPGAAEVCDDKVDNDCDGFIDFQDGCAPRDEDHDGYPFQQDCDDFNALVNWGAQELCYNGIDDNCDGLADASAPECNNDADGDGWPSNSDCDDFNSQVNPGWGELCGDGIDNDCDGLVDPYPNCTDGVIDWDRDGYPNQNDCDDGNAATFPGSPFEKCCDGIDSDCDGADTPANGSCVCGQSGDMDGDGYTVGMSDPRFADCNDQDATVHPQAGEDCQDKRDNDCDGRVDYDDPDCIVVPID